MKVAPVAEPCPNRRATEQSPTASTVSALSLLLVGLAVTIAGFLVHLYSTTLAGAHLVLIPAGILLIVAAIVTSGAPDSPWTGVWRLLGLLHAVVMLWMLTWDAILLNWATRAPPLLGFLVSVGGIFALCGPPRSLHSIKGEFEYGTFVRRLLTRGTGLTLGLTGVLLFLEWRPLLVRVTMMFDSPRATVSGVAWYLVELPIRVLLKF